MHLHSCMECNLFERPIIYTLGSFRMPLYFILSGLFFKEYGGFKDFTKRKINKLLVPFFFFYILFSWALPICLDLADGVLTGTKLLKYSYGWLSGKFYNQATWFLEALFFTNILFYIIIYYSKKINTQILFIIIASLICGTIGIILDKFRINIPLFIDTSFSSVPFFCFGFLTKKYTRILYPNKYDKYNLLFIIGLFFIFLIPYNIGHQLISMRQNRFFVNPMIVYLCGISGTLFVLLLCKKINKYAITKPLSFIGRYSIMLLLTHRVLLNLITRYWGDILPGGSLGVAIRLAIITIICASLVPVMKKYIPQFTAQKDLI